MSRPPYKAPAGGNRRIALAFLGIILAFTIIAYAVAFWPRDDDDDAPDSGTPAAAIFSTGTVGIPEITGRVTARTASRITLIGTVTILSNPAATSDWSGTGKTL